MRRLIAPVALAACLALGACAAKMQDTPPPDVARAQDLAGLPYTPLVYHLDLSVLAYQLYGQTLAWPFDPYYEEFAGRGRERRQVMDRVRDWARATGAEQRGTRPPLGGYRGPGMLAGFADNRRSDPIVYRYDRLDPGRPTVSNPAGRWTEYTPPAEIAGPIRDVFMCYRPTGRTEGEVAVDRVVRRATRGRDALLAFEGGTGDKGEAGQPASQSLMGFVLLRHLPQGGYDIHVVFRGSRSGSAQRAMVQANFTSLASGNPDWITDLGHYRIGPDEGAAVISTKGRVQRGFARAMQLTLPQVAACLGRAAALAPGARPRNIYVTGHSLGGGMAQHFVSAVLMGNRYGPDGRGPAMAARLKAWPWTKVKLITFGAPTAGDVDWAGPLTRDKLQSGFFNTLIEPIDLQALAVHDPSILPRLTDPSRPAGFRVLISTDPITTEKFTDGKHVGKTVYANKLGPLAPFAVGKPRSHEPEHIRELMMRTLEDPRNPPSVIRYRAMSELNPGRNRSGRGTLAEIDRLAAALLRYHAQRSPGFDTRALQRDFAIYRALVAAP